MDRVKSALVRTGLATPPLEPHEFAVAMHLLPLGMSTPVAMTPNIVTPSETAHCAREGCGRIRADPIHTIPEG